MIEKITLDMLTQESARVKKQNFVDVNGVLQPVGQPWRREYVNSEQDRAKAATEIPEPYKSAVFAAWGENPTVFPVDD
jgi:hypothetical protein